MHFHSHEQELTESATDGVHSPRFSRGLLLDQSGGRTANRLNRSSPILTLLQYSCLALGGRLDGELASFWKSVGYADLPFDATIERFAHFLKRRVENGTVRIYFLPELLDFELAMHELRFTSRGPYFFEEGPERGKPREPSVLVRRGTRLELHPLMRVLRFPCDAQALFETLAHGDCIHCNVRSYETFVLLSALRDPAPELRHVPAELGRKLWALQCVGTFGGCDADVVTANRLVAEPQPN